MLDQRKQILNILVCALIFGVSVMLISLIVCMRIGG